MSHKCPVCSTPLSKQKFEKIMGVAKAREADIAKKEHDLKIRQLNLKNAVQAAKYSGVQTERIRNQRIIGTWQKRYMHMEKKTKVLEQKMHSIQTGITPQVEGLEFEENLVEKLRNYFLKDVITKFGKGGDVLHAITHEGECIGKIIYECKRTESIPDSHIRQTLAAKNERQADFGVLVTTGQRKGFHSFVIRNKVLVVSPGCVIPLVAYLRENLIEMHRAKEGTQGLGDSVDKLLKYLNSPAFKNHFESITHSGEELRRGLYKEIRDQYKGWKRRWDLYQKIEWEAQIAMKNIMRLRAGKSPILEKRSSGKGELIQYLKDEVAK